jgi:phosphoglycolate phosphatase
MLLVFDLDGTLINSRRDLAESANELLEGYGAAALDEEAVGRMVGEGAGVLVSRVLAARRIDAPHAEALARYLAIYDRRLLDHTVAYDGIDELLDTVRPAARLAVLTNKPAQPTNRILAALELDTYFEWVIGGDSRFGKKPSPDALRWLMEQARASSSDTVLVGDSLVDVQTARAAGAIACVARYGFGYLNMPADGLDGRELLIDAPSDLPAILRAHLSPSAAV